MDIFHHMDTLLASAVEQGHRPLHFLVRQDDWLEIGDRLGRNLIADPSTVGAKIYRDIPVQFYRLAEREIVGIAFENSDPIFALEA